MFMGTVIGQFLGGMCSVWWICQRQSHPMWLFQSQSFSFRLVQYAPYCALISVSVESDQFILCIGQALHEFVCGVDVFLPTPFLHSKIAVMNTPLSHHSKHSYRLNIIKISTISTAIKLVMLLLCLWPPWSVLWEDLDVCSMAEICLLLWSVRDVL